jgi:hypothetical protein
LLAASTAAPAASSWATTSLCPIMAALCRGLRASCNPVKSRPRECQERLIRTNTAVISAVSCARQQRPDNEGCHSCTPQKLHGAVATV